MKNFMLFWFSQFISSMGSSMTAFAITIWAYQRTGSALILSISGLFIMLPRMLGGIFVAPLIDRFNKKTVLLLSDIGAAVCTLVLFLLLSVDRLAIWHVYLLNMTASALGSVQLPAYAATVSLLTPKTHYVKAGGMQSFADGSVQILAPMLAAAMLSIAGMRGVVMLDIVSMLFACGTLLFFVKIPARHINQHINQHTSQHANQRTNRHANQRTNRRINEKTRWRPKQYFADLREGFHAIRQTPLLHALLRLHIFINFVAGITYYTLISPMILARTDNDAAALALVNAGLGIGGLVGGLFIALLPTAKRKIKVMFFFCGLSFLLGDVTFALGQTLWIWVTAGVVSNVLIPPFTANENYFWRTALPLSLHGRVFSIKHAVQSGVIPLGMVLGGLLSDKVFEPFMARPRPFLNRLVGSGDGSGMALMFLITGITGTVICLCGFFSRSLALLEEAE